MAASGSTYCTFDFAIYRVLPALEALSKSSHILSAVDSLLSDASPPPGWLSESDSPARRKYADASRSGAREQSLQRAPPVRRSSDTCRGSGRAYGALTARLEPEMVVLDMSGRCRRSGLYSPEIENKAVLYL